MIAMVIDVLDKLDKDLKLLKVNETQMSKEMLIKKAPTLKKLKNRIITYASQVLKHFILSGVWIFEDETSAVKNKMCQDIQAIIDDEQSKGKIKRLYDILLLTYSLDTFLDAVYDLENKIKYQVYMPYWVSKCEKRQVSQCDWNGLKGQAWYNPIIDMFWHEELSIWVSVTEVSWGTYLPPTMEMYQEKYITKKGKVR